MKNNTPKLIDIEEKAAGLYNGEYGGRLNDYRDSDTYICDAISEIADSDTSIYYSDILNFISEHPDALADAVEEGLYQVDGSTEYDLYKHGQAAEYMLIERDIYNNLRDSLLLCAIDFIRYDLKLDEVSEELYEFIEELADNADNNDRMSDIPDSIREFIEENKA